MVSQEEMASMVVKGGVIEMEVSVSKKGDMELLELKRRLITKESEMKRAGKKEKIMSTNMVWINNVSLTKEDGAKILEVRLIERGLYSIGDKIMR